MTTTKTLKVTKSKAKAKACKSGLCKLSLKNLPKGVNLGYLKVKPIVQTKK